MEKQIPEQTKDLGISEEDVAEIAHVFAAFPTNALTGQSMIVSHGWFME